MKELPIARKEKCPICRTKAVEHLGEKDGYALYTCYNGHQFKIKLSEERMEAKKTENKLWDAFMSLFRKEKK